MTHGTIFRRAIEEGLIDPTRMYQIGLRGTGYSAEDFDWTRKQGAVVASPQRDAFILRRLRAAGALILGKGNLSEWAGQRSNYASGGWSGRGGQTRKPYAPDCSPAGSSSGLAVAVAVAADLTVVAIDTDTGGSICGPASAKARSASGQRSASFALGDHPRRCELRHCRATDAHGS